MFPPSDIAAAKSNSLQILPSIDTQKGKKNNKNFSAQWCKILRKKQLYNYMCASLNDWRTEP